nr:hypothetical protein HK105_002807 [Polyrhizophydium stewartii]
MSDYPSSVYQIFSSLSCLVLDQSVCDARSTSTTWGSSSFVRNSVSLGLGKLLLYTVDALTEILNGLRTGSVDPSQAKAKFLDEVLEPDYRDGWRRLEQMTLDSTNQVISMATMSNILLCFAEFVVLCIAEIAVFWRTIWFCSGLDRSATDLPSEVKRNPHFLAALRPLLSQGSSRGRSVTSQRRCCRWHWIKAQEGQVHPDDQTLGSEDSLDDAASLDADGQNLLVMLSGGQNQERAESHESLAAKITSSHEQLFDDDDDDSEYEDGDDDDNNDPSARASGSGGGLGRKPTVGRLISPDDEKMDINERIEAFRASSVVPPPRTHDAHSETAVRVGGPADADPFADRAEE